MDFSFLSNSDYVGMLLQGLGMTIILSILSVIFGTMLGFIPAWMRLSKNKLLNFIGTTYVEIIRGTPLLVQLLLIYAAIQIPFVLILGLDMSSFVPGIIALLINTSAYVSEVIRGGILSVDKGQTEAALSLGMSKGQTMRRIVLPQAIKNIIPALRSEEHTSELQSR